MTLTAHDPAQLDGRRPGHRAWALHPGQDARTRDGHQLSRSAANERERRGVVSGGPKGTGIPECWSSLTRSPATETQSERRCSLSSDEYRNEPDYLYVLEP
jgi:hypothetical protein